MFHTTILHLATILLYRDGNMCYFIIFRNSTFIFQILHRVHRDHKVNLLLLTVDSVCHVFEQRIVRLIQEMVRIHTSSTGSGHVSLEIPFGHVLVDSIDEVFNLAQP